MGEVVEFTADSLAFDPHDIEVMSRALDEICKVLNVPAKTTARELIAIRILELVRRGERDLAALQHRVLTEANGGSGC